jgi:ribosome-binding factor A
MESRRQQQVASIIQEVVSDVFTKHGRNYYGNAFVTISNVRVTPDLLVARINVSILAEQDRKPVMEALKHHAHEVRKHLGNQVKNQLRRVPELEFYLDESLDEVFKIDRLLKEIKEKEQADKKHE